MNFNEIIVPIISHKLVYYKPCRACCYIPKEWMHKDAFIIKAVSHLVDLLNSLCEVETLIEFNPKEDVYYGEREFLNKDILLSILDNKEYFLCFSKKNFSDEDNDLWETIAYNKTVLIPIDELVENEIKIHDQLLGNKKPLDDKLNEAIEKLSKLKSNNNEV